MIMFTISTGESLTRTAFPFESMVEIYASYDKVDEFSLSWNLLRLKFLIAKLFSNKKLHQRNYSATNEMEKLLTKTNR